MPLSYTTFVYFCKRTMSIFIALYHWDSTKGDILIFMTLFAIVFHSSRFEHTLEISCLFWLNRRLSYFNFVKGYSYSSLSVDLDRLNPCVPWPSDEFTWRIFFNNDKI